MDQFPTKDRYDGQLPPDSEGIAAELDEVLIEISVIQYRRTAEARELLPLAERRAAELRAALRAKTSTGAAGK